MEETPDIGVPRTGTVDAARARELLAEIETLRRDTRRPRGLWPPLVIFGVVATLGAPLALVSDLAVNLWWFVTAPAAFAAVGFYSARQARRHGIESPGWPMYALGAASFAACWLACLVAPRVLHWPAGLGWTVAVTAGYLAWSRFARSWPAALLALALAVVGIGLALSPLPGWTVEFAVGITMIIGGLLLRAGPEAP